VELRYLLYFATVAEQQSFTRASEKLHIAQSAISQQIKTLEEELQVRLLLRTKRSVKLTAFFAGPTIFSIELKSQKWKRGGRREEKPAHCLSDSSRRDRSSFCRS
jgi:Bacterial regulatory helix-turn-helix protein, lysR family